MKKRMLLIVSVIVSLDQLIKLWIRMHEHGAKIAEIEGLVRITHSVNTGAAFSILAGKTPLLAVVSSALLVWVCLYAVRQMNLTAAAQAALACMVGGGLGNLIDRVVYGGVTDYVQLLVFDFPIFNAADAAITGSVAALMVLLLAGKLENSSGDKDGSDH